MCGISVIFSNKTGEYLDSILAMTDIIAHRGPDDEGFAFFSLDSNQPIKIYGGEKTPESILRSNLPYTPKQRLGLSYKFKNYHVAFGHRRLSIIDLSEAGHQPLCEISQRYWITYNGEIYNYIELRKELEDNGYTFVSHTDTEMILHAYHHWGIDCLHKFNGMFSFAIYDHHEKIIFAARDRFAVKPLYYWVSPLGFTALASEIKQFTVLPGWKAKLNHQAAYDFLNWGMTNHNIETCFKDVYQVQGGHYLFIDLKQTMMQQPKKWYHLPVGHYRGTLTEAADEFRFLLKDSVKLRCRADVTVGSCLSGGLDSSSIVCLMHQLLQEQKSTNEQLTFSACSHVKKFDESEYMRQVIEQTGVQAHVTYPNLNDLLKDLETILWHQDEPFGSTSIFAQWEVFKLVKTQNVKVMLDGQGADEQLAGYSGFHSARFADLVRNFQFLTLRKEIKQCKELYELNHPLKLLLNHLLPNWVRQPLLQHFKKTTQRAPWMNCDLLDIVEIDPHRKDVPIDGFLQKQCYSQITCTNLPMLLHFEDRDSMAHSIEARTPFLDYRLVEFILSLPAEFKLSGGKSKVVLREGMKGIIPEGIRCRTSKLGFATPEEVWVRENPALFEEMMKNSLKQAYGILNEKSYDLAKRIINAELPYNHLLWRFIIFGKWLKLYSLN